MVTRLPTVAVIAGTPTGAVVESREKIHFLPRRQQKHKHTHMQKHPKSATASNAKMSQTSHENNSAKSHLSYELRKT